MVPLQLAFYLKMHRTISSIHICLQSQKIYIWNLIATWKYHVDKHKAIEKDFWEGKFTNPTLHYFSLETGTASKPFHGTSLIEKGIISSKNTIIIGTKLFYHIIHIIAHAHQLLTHSNAGIWGIIFPLL
ncbi:hypothetical protein ACJX0J_009460 [Zea mays]